MNSLKRKEQHKNKESARINSKVKNSIAGKAKRKATEQTAIKKINKNPKSSEKSIKANNTQHKEKLLEQSKEQQTVEEITTNFPTRNESDHQAERLINDLHKSKSEQDNLRSMDNKAAKFLEKCEKSKFLKVGKRNATTNEIIPIQLPDGLPNKILMKALLKEQQTLTVLHDQVIQLDQEDESSIDVHLESVNRDQLTTLVKELDGLVGQFTARN